PRSPTSTLFPYTTLFRSNEMLEDFIAAFDYLKNNENCDGNIGVVGFCFGGWIANMMAVKVPTLKAAVPFYGGQPTAEEAAKIKTDRKSTRLNSSHVKISY